MNLVKMSKKNPGLPQLTRAEETVMQALWQYDKAFVKDIIAQMPEPKPHANTVNTVFKILAEKGFVKSCVNPDFQLKKGAEIVNVDENYFRPTEVELLIGNPAKAKAKLGWEPSHTLNDLVREMVAADLDTFKKEKHLIDSGFFISQSIEH